MADRRHIRVSPLRPLVYRQVPDTAIIPCRRHNNKGCHIQEWAIITCRQALAIPFRLRRRPCSSHHNNERRRLCNRVARNTCRPRGYPEDIRDDQRLNSSRRRNRQSSALALRVWIRPTAMATKMDGAVAQAATCRLHHRRRPSHTCAPIVREACLRLGVWIGPTTATWTITL